MILRATFGFKDAALAFKSEEQFFKFFKVELTVAVPVSLVEG